MAEVKAWDFGEATQITITNTLSEDAGFIKDVPTGEKVAMTLKAAKEARYHEYEFILAANGNFTKIGTNGDPEVIADSSTAIKEDEVAVQVRRAVRPNTRVIQFYQTQQKMVLNPGDSVSFVTKCAPAAAYYLSLNGVDGIEVKDQKVDA